MNTVKTLNKQDYIKLLPFVGFYFILTWLVSGNVFFWDTVQLGSKHGLFFYETNFSSILLPDDIDSGHIPTFGMYLAAMWNVFGKTLLVSHFAMLPFLIGIVFQTFILLRRFISEKYIYLALILFLADSTLLSQSVLMSPDVILVFFFLLSLNSVLNNKKTYLSLAVFGLFLISMRGMMVAFAMLILDVIINIRYDNLKSVLSNF